jgi:hypothetical protein
VTFLSPYSSWDEWDEWSGYAPPNSDLARLASLDDDLPAPVYDINEASGPYVQEVDWAEALIMLAVERFGVDYKGNYGSGPGMAVWCPDCGCGWTSAIDTWEDDKRVPASCWYCHPKPAPALILLHARD